MDSAETGKKVLTPDNTTDRVYFILKEDGMKNVSGQEYHESLLKMQKKVLEYKQNITRAA